VRYPDALEWLLQQSDLSCKRTRQEQDSILSKIVHEAYQPELASLVGVALGKRHTTLRCVLSKTVT
jgi:hypothetical protein